MATPNTESRLTPPIVDDERPKNTMELDPDLTQISAVEVEAATEAEMSPEQIERGLRARLTGKNRELEHAISERDRWGKKVTALRAEVAETERWLRAAQPRSRKTAK